MMCEIRHMMTSNSRRDAPSWCSNSLFRPRGVRCWLVLLAGCGGGAKLPVTAGMGPHPELPPPRTSMFPVVSVAEAVGWHAGEKPTAAQGLAVSKFGDGLNHPRWLYVL